MWAGNILEGFELWEKFVWKFNEIGLLEKP